MYKPVEKLINLSTLTATINQGKLKELSEFSLYSLLAFSIPFMLSGPQMLIGTLVNTSLIGSALYMKSRKLLPIIMLPSIGVLSRGIIFGPLTLYLVYLLPFIWIGNAILIFSIKLIYLKLRKPYLLAALLGSTIKFIFLVSSAFVLYSLNIIPVAFLVAMGIMQLITAATASAIMFPINRARTKFRK